MWIPGNDILSPTQPSLLIKPDTSKDRNLINSKAVAMMRNHRTNGAEPSWVAFRPRYSTYRATVGLLDYTGVDATDRRASSYGFDFNMRTTLAEFRANFWEQSGEGHRPLPNQTDPVGPAGCRADCSAGRN